MKLKYLLDTNIISEPLRPQPNPLVLARLERASGEMALPSVVWHELIYGMERLPTGRRRTYLQHYLRDVIELSFEILPYTAKAAGWHGQERARLERLGHPSAFADGQVAAIAAVQGLILVSRNIRHLQVFSGLALENWFEPESTD